MAVSLLNRVTGAGLATVGAALFVWWLAAAATGADAYAKFIACVTSPFGVVVGIGLTWALFFHGFAGLRHFVLDMGAGYELKTNKSWSIAVMLGSVVATAALWLYIFGIGF